MREGRARLPLYHTTETLKRFYFFKEQSRDNWSNALREGPVMARTRAGEKGRYRVPTRVCSRDEEYSRE